MRRARLLMFVGCLLLPLYGHAEELVRDPQFREVVPTGGSGAWKIRAEEAVVQSSASGLSINARQARSSVYLSQEFPVSDEMRGKVLTLDLQVDTVAGGMMVFPWAQALDDEDRRTVTADSRSAVIYRGLQPQYAQLAMYIPHWTHRVVVGIGATGPGDASVRVIHGWLASQEVALPPAQVASELAEFESAVRQFSLAAPPPDFAAGLEKVRSEADFGLSRLAMDGLLAYALRELGDPHAHLVSSSTVSQESARTPDNIDTRQLSASISYVRVPSLHAPARAEADFASAQAYAIRRLAPLTDCGWIIDLRENSGGNMWPMLQGLADFFPDGEIGHFVKADLAQTWHFVQGKASLDGKPKVELSDSNVQRAVITRPVAVLISSHTASSGEALVIAFKARPRSVLIGEKTAGLATTVASGRLAGGLLLSLASARMSDIHGAMYPYGISPDISSDSPEAALTAAEKWLEGECRRAVRNVLSCSQFSC